MRSNERDFIISKRKKYLRKLNKLYRDFLKQIDKVVLNDQEKARTKKFFTEYVEVLNKYAKTIEDINRLKGRLSEEAEALMAILEILEQSDIKLLNDAENNR